jgi:hypothetical protein
VAPKRQKSSNKIEAYKKVKEEVVRQVEKKMSKEKKTGNF